MPAFLSAGLFIVKSLYGFHRQTCPQGLLGGIVKTFRPPLTSLLPLALEFVVLLIFCVVFFDANDWREFLPGNNAGILDYALLGIALLVPLYFVYGAAERLYSRITVERDAFVLHRLFGVSQLCKLFGVTRIPFKNIAAIHIQKTEADLLVPLFSIFGREHRLLDLGCGCLVFVLKERDDEYLEGFTPKTADKLRKILEDFEKS